MTNDNLPLPGEQPSNLNNQTTITNKKAEKYFEQFILFLTFGILIGEILFFGFIWIKEFHFSDLLQLKNYVSALGILFGSYLFALIIGAIPAMFTAFIVIETRRKKYLYRHSFLVGFITCFLFYGLFALVSKNSSALTVCFLLSVAGGVSSLSTKILINKTILKVSDV